MATDRGDFTLDAILADSAAAADGKLYVQGGGWNMVNSDKLPVKIARVGLAAVVGVPYTQTNKQHRLGFVLLAADGQGVAPDGALVPPDHEGLRIHGHADFTIGRPPNLQSGDRQNIPIAVNIDGVSFAMPGLYSFVFTIDDHEINRLEFRVVTPPAIQLQA
jgi:hypothetical protein